MPVLGHALVGLAMGLCTEPSREGSAASRDASRGSALWIPLVVGLAYLPDVTAQLLLLAGWSEGRVMSHSVLFAVVASAAIAPALARILPVSPLRLFIISLGSILLHDLLDIAQATDRVPWWPLSDRHIVLPLTPIPTDAWKEALLFGSLFMAFLVCRQVGVALRANRRGHRAPPTKRPARLVWVSRVAIIAIVLAAATTHYLRDVREGELDHARTLLAQGDYRGALAMLDRADRWPSTAKLSRIDYLRAEAYAGIGDRSRAETHYLRSYHADPTYFWVVADLAVFYASSNRPLDERRRLIAPYLRRLHTEFGDQKYLPAVLARIDRHLAAPQP